jgi:hypothetical protein
MKYPKSLLAASLAASLVAVLVSCQKPNILEEGIEQAKRTENPYEAAEIVTQADQNYHDGRSVVSLIFGIVFTDFDEMMARRKATNKIIGDYLVKAVELGDVRAIDRVLESRFSNETLEKAAPFIMAHAQKSDASAETLLAASTLTLDGRYVQKDFQQSFDFLVRSWKLSQNPHAAIQAREIFMSLHDGANAYLWSLRGSRISPWPGAWFENERSPQEKVNIQRMAHDPSVLLIGISPLKPIATDL